MNNINLKEKLKKAKLIASFLGIALAVAVQVAIGVNFIAPVVAFIAGVAFAHLNYKVRHNRIMLEEEGS